MRFRSIILTGMLVLVCFTTIVSATPSSTFWTPMTLDMQSFGVFHIGVDNYFTTFQKFSDGGGMFPTDAGLTVGVLPYNKVQMEVGIDYLEASDYPVFFNAKIGTPQDTLFKGAPALEVGIFNVGTKKDVTNQNIFHFVVGKTIPSIGRISAGPYIGNGKVLRSGEGKEENTGFMVAFDRAFLPVKDSSGNEYSKLVFAADYASGDNALGAGGFGLYYFFTKDISLLTGPVFFHDEQVNGKWKWSIQLDINLPRVGK